MDVTVDGLSLVIPPDVEFYIRDVLLNTDNLTSRLIIGGADGDYHLRFTLNGDNINQFSPNAVCNFYLVRVDDTKYNPNRFSANDFFLKNISSEDMLVLTANLTNGVLSIVQLFANTTFDKLLAEGGRAGTAVVIDETGHIPSYLINESQLTVPRLTTPRRITLSKHASGYVDFDGSKDVQLPVTINNTDLAAARIKTPFNLILGGDVTGEFFSIDCSGDATASVTVDPDKHIHSNIYTKSEIDSSIYKKSDFQNIQDLVYRTSNLNITVSELPLTDLDQRYFLISNIGNYVTTSSLGSNYYSKIQIDSSFYKKSDFSGSVADIVYKGDTIAIADIPPLNTIYMSVTERGNYYTKSEIDYNFYTRNDFGTIGNLVYAGAGVKLEVTDIPDLSSKYVSALALNNYYNKNEVNSKFNDTILTGSPTAPNPPANSMDNTIATTKFVQDVVDTISLSGGLTSSSTIDGGSY
jgi:hypothetical protein